MIRGLLFHVKGQIVHQWMRDQVDHHRQRAAFYIDELKKMDAAGIEIQNMTGDARKAMQDKAKSHQADAAEFVMMAEHLKVDEVYQLDRSDLAKLGKIRSAY